jgi:hypothetical protein
MTKNQKIAVGCGAVGCLGLIVLGLVGGGIAYWQYKKGDSVSLNDNRRYSSNSNSNSNSDTDSNSKGNSNSTNSSSSNTTTSSYSDDDKHKLFQAASMTQDAEVVQKVVKKLGLFKANGTPADDYPQFIKDHITWGASNAAFITSVSTPEKARAYVDEHL